MAILLSLAAAVAFGLSDFVGGLASRRVSPWTVAFVASLSGAAGLLVFALVVGGSPTGADFAWATLAGLGNGLGTSFLYRGLSAGRMGVVAPVSGVGSALVPLMAGLLGGERPAVLAWCGFAVALPAIYLVAREPHDESATASASMSAGLVDGVLAGLGFGVLFAAVGQIPEEAGFLPLALNQLVGAGVVATVATIVAGTWVPRERAAAAGLVCGVLGASATALFLVSTHLGFLTVSAVIASLYPAFTVLLAVSVLREQIRRDQAFGLALCAAAVALIAVA